MADLLKLCKKYFGKKDLYEVFGITKDANEKESKNLRLLVFFVADFSVCREFDFCLTVRRAYHRLSLKVHPDRVAEDEKAEATEKFKVISAVHSILSTKSKRELYDKTGEYHH